jgi:hypothetical protein
MGCRHSDGRPLSFMMGPQTGLVINPKGSTSVMICCPVVARVTVCAESVEALWSLLVSVSGPSADAAFSCVA